MWRLKKKLISKLYFTQLYTLTYYWSSIGYSHMLMIWKLSRSDFPSLHRASRHSNIKSFDGREYWPPRASSLILVVLETHIWVTSIKEIYYIHIKNWIAPRHNAPVKSTIWFTLFHYYNIHPSTNLFCQEQSSTSVWNQSQSNFKLQTTQFVSSSTHLLDSEEPKCTVCIESSSQAHHRLGCHHAVHTVSGN